MRYLLKTFKSAYDDNESEEAVDLMAESFWTKYMEKLSKCHSEEKCKQLILNLKDTTSRLFAIEDEIQTTSCTWWQAEHTLFFDPTVIDFDHITREQRNSFIVMHDHSSESITINIILHSLTWTFILKACKRATYENIKDGIRLWSTIPFKIQRINITRPGHLSGWTVMLRIILSWMSEKIQKRIVVIDS